MNPADQPGKSTPTPILVPDESKSVTNISHRVSSNPNLTSSSVQPGESQPDEEPPVPVPNENIVPEHAHHSRELGVSASRQETYGSTCSWINKWLSSNHIPDLMHPNQSYPKSLENFPSTTSRAITCSRLCRALPSSLPTMLCQSPEVPEFWTLLRS